MGPRPDLHPALRGTDSNCIIAALRAHLDHPEPRLLRAWAGVCTLSTSVPKYNAVCISLSS